MCGVSSHDGVGGKEFERRQWRENWGPKCISSAASMFYLTALTLEQASSKFLYTYDNGKVKRKAYHCFWLRLLPTMENTIAHLQIICSHLKGLPLLMASGAETEYSGILLRATCPAWERGIGLALDPKANVLGKPALVHFKNLSTIASLSPQSFLVEFRTGWSSAPFYTR